jgi:hypothetical protein
MGNQNLFKAGLERGNPKLFTSIIQRLYKPGIKDLKAEG